MIFPIGLMANIEEIVPFRIPDEVEQKVDDYLSYIVQLSDHPHLLLPLFAMVPKRTRIKSIKKK